MNHNTTTCPSGKALKDAAHQLLEQHRAAAILAGRHALLAALLSGAQHVTADTVRDAVDLPQGVDPKCFGCVPTALAKAGIIAKCGYTETARATAHSRPVAQWRLRDRTAAVKWLADHPASTMPPLPPGQASLFGDVSPQQLPD